MYLVKVFVVRLMAQVTVGDCAAEHVDEQNILKLLVSSWRCATEWLLAVPRQNVGCTS